MFQTKLIKLYCAVCDNSSIIERENQRQSNNFRPQFTDEECITVYLWGISQRRFKLKDIYNYIKNHLLEWFPKLPSYQAFSRRCNALASAMRALSEVWMNTARASLHSESVYLVDSCPIMLAHRSRACHAKVASDLCAVSYNSTRKEWYYGVKLHAFATRRPKKLPLPAAMMFSKADVHDLTAAKQMTQDMDFLSHCTVMGDKAYADMAWRSFLKEICDTELATPRKKHMGDMLCSSDTYSTFVSSVRQPIESFFHWLDYLTGIQAASTVRSSQGLLLHVFGRLAFAMAFFAYFNS